MHLRPDLLNHTWGKLTVIKPYLDGGGHYLKGWVVRCECGREFIMTSPKIKQHAVDRCSYCRNNDLTGQRFGKLVVLERVGESHLRGILWKCQCDCGKTRNFYSTTLRIGRTTTCGCGRAEITRQMWIRRGIPSDTARRQVLSEYKRSARRRDFAFELTDEEAIELMTGDCFYCGSKPSVMRYTSNSKFIYNGIDRLDSSKGYIKGNVVPCCTRCNRAKSTMNGDEFIAWVIHTADHLSGRA